MNLLYFSEFLTTSILAKSLMNCWRDFLLSSTAMVVFLELMSWLMSVWTLMMALEDSGNLVEGNCWISYWVRPKVPAAARRSS